MATIETATSLNFTVRKVTPLTNFTQYAPKFANMPSHVGKGDERLMTEVLKRVDRVFELLGFATKPAGDTTYEYERRDTPSGRPLMVSWTTHEDIAASVATVMKRGPDDPEVVITE